MKIIKIADDEIDVDVTGPWFSRKTKKSSVIIVRFITEPENVLSESETYFM